MAIFKCSHCERVVNLDSENSYRGVGENDCLCRECFVEHYFTCQKCFKLHLKENIALQRIAGKGCFCKECSDNAIKECGHCGEKIHTINDRGFQYVNGTPYHNNCYHLYNWCDECGKFHLQEDSYFSEQSGRTYCEWCWEHDADENYLRNQHEFECQPLNLRSNTFKHLRDKRCFGIELEVNDKELPYYKIRKETHFGSKHDGSLNCGSEFYSPILQGDKGYNQVKSVCKLLVGSNIGTCTGFHLHLDARDIRWQTARKIWVIYSILEGVLFAMLPDSRQYNDYARRSILSNFSYIKNVRCYDSFLEYWYEEHGNDGDTCDHYNETRYQGCNLHSYFYQQTIEIRYHSGTTDFEKVMNWVKINQAIVKYAQTHTLDEIISLKNFGNCKTNYGIIRKLFKKVVSNDTLWRYYKTRFAKFSEKEREYGYYKQKPYCPVEPETKEVLTGSIDSVEINNDDCNVGELGREVFAEDFNDSWVLFANRERASVNER